jgi:predicted alpha/beta-fold hydrolase
MGISPGSASINSTTSPNWSADPIVPEFEPHPWVQGGNRQTIVGRYLSGQRLRLEATEHVIELSDGDRLVALESVPRGRPESRLTAVLVHGLGGCAEASYVVRLARRLLRLGAQVIRINLRGAGAGFGLARGIYHAGRSEDLREVATWLHGRTNAVGSSIAFVGYSLGGNLF